jgi:hypothetical protein
MKIIPFKPITISDYLYDYYNRILLEQDLDEIIIQKRAEIRKSLQERKEEEIKIKSRFVSDYASLAKQIIDDVIKTVNKGRS